MGGEVEGRRGDGDEKEGRIALRGQERCETSLNVRNQMFLMGVSAPPLN